MVRQRVSLVLSLAFLLPALLPHIAIAFTNEAPGVGWAPADRPVPYYINPDQYPGTTWDPDYELVKSAFVTWEIATYGNLRFSYMSETNHTAADSDGVNTISFGDPEDRLEPRIQARTFYWVSSDPNDTFEANGQVYRRLLETDILFNNDSYPNWSWGPPEDLDDLLCGQFPVGGIADVHTVAVHEIGHVVGLWHTHDPRTVMYERARDCDETAAILSPDDVAGARSIYPPPGNAAYRSSYVIGTSGNFEGTESSTTDITDGSFSYDASNTDGCAGWRNDDYGQMLSVHVVINLGQDCHVTAIRYNMGNVQRADTWNADVMITPFGQGPTNPGTPYSGAWTEQTGDLTMRSVSVTFRKTRVSAVTDWLFIGEIEVIGTPLAAETVVSSEILGGNNTNTDPTAALGLPDEAPVSLGVGGEIVLALPEPIYFERPGSDLAVHESLNAHGVGFRAETDTIPEPYSVYGSSDGTTWELLSSLVGTGSIDLRSASYQLQRCGLQYLRIVDGGGGDPNGTSPGVDLDGISFPDTSLVSPCPIIGLGADANFTNIRGPLAWRPDASGFYVSYKLQGDDYAPFRIGFLPSGGGALTEVAHGMYPALSPDGRRLACFSGGFMEYPNLTVYNLDTGEHNDIWTGGGSSPTWSLDGSVILFLYRGDIYSIPPAGGTPSRVLDSSIYPTDGVLQWNHDQSMFAYTETPGTEHSVDCGGGLPIPGAAKNRIAIQRFPSGAAVNTIQLGRSSEWPTWSPDGEFLCFAVRRGYDEFQTELWAARVFAPTETLQVTLNVGMSIALGWSPIGHQLAFASLGPEGDYEFARLDELSFGWPTGVQEPGANTSAISLTLDPQFPNPFREALNIGFVLLGPSNVTARIYDVTGRLVRSLCDHRVEAGRHTLIWDGRDDLGASAPSGVYMITVANPGHRITRKAVRVE